MKTNEKQREAIRKYEESHDRITVICAKGTRQRIEKLGLNVSPARFAAFAVEFMLNDCERRARKNV